LTQIWGTLGHPRPRSSATRSRPGTLRVPRDRTGGQWPAIRARLESLARNLWWTWQPDPQRLFAALDPVQWEVTHHNPIATLASLPPERQRTLQEDRDFLDLLEECERQLATYFAARTWFQRSFRGRQRQLRVAYLCAEYGLHECLPLYAGGLGVLAGDHLKSASDLGIPLVAVGLLYRYGYYRQELRRDGTTRVVYPRLDFARLPLAPTRLTISVPLGNRLVRARIWQAQVGRVPLYLLDTDIPENQPRDRAITAHLYGGDQDMRLRQEILLGMGGVRALRAVGVDARVFHLNEGHAAFCGLERLAHLRASGLTAERAMARVAATTVFTTHTPVAAGHDRFPPALLLRYLRPRLAEFGLSADALLALGREKLDNRREPFCMTVLALRLSGQRNGVSAIHGRVSRAMWTRVFHARRPEEVPIGHITNGVHSETWLAPEMRLLYERYLKPRWLGASPQDDWWKHANRIPPAEWWHIRNLLRRKLVHFVRQRLQEQIQRRCGPLPELVAALETFDEHALTIGFARRFATYKRAPLIFQNARRLAAILNRQHQPVQIVFAGKAHPADAAGQRYAQRIYRLARQNGFRGRVVLLEDYDMHVGRLLTAGCDVWLNTPRPPLEASGTSGMKPPLHGGLNCSVADGWWPEAYNGRNGWIIRTDPQIRGCAAQDRQTANALYDLLEQQIVPLFYRRDRHGVPRGWVRRMAAAMQSVCGRFNTHRMISEYVQLYVRCR
jgi:starch phosphorylase